jgi:hypothetical protein
VKDLEQIQALLLETDPDVRRVMARGLISAEYQRAKVWPAMNSAHEGYAVLAEEVDELWDHVKVKQGSRNIEKMTYEAVQVAAMALRFIIDVCHPVAAAK